ncbi:MAG TPA: VOC family protein [Ilumatobacter sp.]|nr:VOC family protein [Ilumatobacter sp.]
MHATTTTTSTKVLDDTGNAVAVPWIGINHLALITNDMDTTVRFWHGVLDAPLVATVGHENFRHYFFAFGESTTVAFFEFSGERAQELNKPAGVFDERATQFDHLSLNLPDEAALLALRDRLHTFGCEVTEVVDHQMIRSIYFSDPNGIALEASWWVKDFNESPPGFSDETFFHDSNPVPAVVELQAGALTRTPVTLLAGASSDQP